jgi:choline-glycine betaine transporter
MCNKRMWVAIGVAAVIALATSSGLAAVGSFLIIGACPLMMLLMGSALMAPMRSRRRPSDDETEVARLRAEVADLRERVEP